jgi:hypothetical protein
MQGAWYDPSDYSTLFQDSAGTTPVTAVEQSVRLMRDKSGNGNHATAPSDASRPVLRSRYNNFVATATLATQSVTTLATTYKLSFSGAGTITLTGTNIGVYSAGTTTITCTAGTLTATVAGTVTDADLRLSSTAASMPAYQLVTTSTNYDTAGFLPYLALDGTDDSFGTGSIDFTATDAMSICAGVTKLSDAAQGLVAELSANVSVNNGAFWLYAPISTVNKNYGWRSKGTASADANEPSLSTVAPITNILTGIGDISGDVSTLRVNGVQAVTSATDQGTGNYGNYPLYIGRRNNTSLPLNGRLYQMVVCGKALSALELSAVETFVNRKTGAY